LNGKTYYSETPVGSTEITNKIYVDTQDTATLASANTYTDIASSNLTDYIDNKTSAQNELSEILANGNSAGAYEIDMNNNKIVNVDTCTASGDAANKFYVDDQNLWLLSGTDVLLKNTSSDIRLRDAETIRFGTGQKGGNLIYNGTDFFFQTTTTSGITAPRMGFIGATAFGGNVSGGSIELLSGAGSGSGNDGDIIFDSKGDISFEDENVTTPIDFSDSSNPVLNTTNQTIVGSINEVKTLIDVVSGDIAGAGDISGTGTANQLAIFSDTKDLISRSQISIGGNYAQTDFGSTSDNTITLTNAGTGLNILGDLRLHEM